MHFDDNKQGNHPIIALVPALTPEDHIFEPFPAYRFEYIKQHYYEALEAFGAVVFLIPATESLERISVYLRLIDGLMLIGGEDIHPEVYGEQLDPLCQPRLPRRDILEKELTRRILASGIPFLGICRGMQMLNIARGGDLHQDLSHYKDVKDHRQIAELDYSASHPILIKRNSQLAKIMGATRIEVNTGHHQGIDRCGRGLRVVAKSTDDVVEAIEGDGFTIGVQWHPEAWLHDTASQRLFSAFVTAARKFNKRK